MLKITYDDIEYKQYDHIYAVSYCGKVLRYNKPYSPKVGATGYIPCGRQQYLHQMVAKCWLKKPKNAIHIHHKDNDPTNNHADNLEWLSGKDHADKHPERGKQSPTKETRDKMRQNRLNTTLSEDTKLKISKGSKQWWKNAKANGYKHDHFLGKKHSKETIAKMKKNHAKNTPCIVFGVEYPSFTIAGNTLGIRPLTLRKRCLSDNFQDYLVKG